MKPSQIKTECELIYTQIKNLEDRLDRLKSICKHKTTFDGNYSDRVASTYQAIICSDCGKVVSPIWEKLDEINSEEI